MQTPKARSGTSEVPQAQRTSPATPRSTRRTKGTGSESDSISSTTPPTKTPTDRSPKVTERRSPRSPVPEKKRSSRVTELESQITQLQEDLKKTKDQLGSSESWKRRALQETEEAKKQFLAMAAKVEDSQRQLVELSSAEEDRIQELRKISQDRDRAWQSEVEAIQKQHSVDSAALTSCMSEIQRLKLQLEKAARSEAAQAKQSEIDRSELQALKEDMVETLSVVEDLKIQLRDSEKTEDEVNAMVSETQKQLEMAKITIETLRHDRLKLMESFSSSASELEESRARVNSLEEIVKKMQADQITIGSQAVLDHAGDCDKTQNNECRSLESEMEQLRSALEAAEIKYQEEQIQSTMQTQTAYELLERVRMESGLKEAELESALKDSKAKIVELKANLIDKETELQSISDTNELNAETEQGRSNQISELESKLMKAIADITELKANLMDKETELQSISEENELLKLNMGKREEESRKSHQVATAEMEFARAAEQEALTRLRFVTEEADKSSRRAARVSEQLDAAQAVKSEMEAELRRLRVQSDQWRKAAEAAAAVLTTGNNGRLMERTGSLDCDYNTVAGKLMSSPYSDDFDDESPKKKNNVLRKFGGLWKKSQK